MKIPKGLEVSICRADSDSRSWSRHVMKRDLDLEPYRTKTVFGSGGAVIFRYEDWLILTRYDRLKENSRA